MTPKEVRVRIAPSPTGYLHVGTGRMAIANYLLARHAGGKFLVRVEDTDKERSKAELIEPILEALKWLGLEWDEDILYQSKRIDHYRKFSTQMIESGHAYRCFCSPELLTADREKAKAEKGPMRYNRRCLSLSDDEVKNKLDAGEKFATRIRMPEGATTYNDLVSGDITRQNEEIEDFIIARSDGSATYNLAVVIDDHDMRISHVIRGNDHITNTFKQIHIYKALGWELPIFGHVPLILRPDKKKVSKRLGDKDVSEYRNEGILPDAMFNYLSLLGWSPKTDREIYSPKELIEIFDETHFNAANAVFDEEKLEAFNREHIQLMSDHDIAATLAPMLVEADLTTKYWLETRWEYLRDVVTLLKPRARRLSDFIELSSYFFLAPVEYDEKGRAKQFVPETIPILEGLAERFEGLNEFTLESTEKALADEAEKLEIKKGKLIHPTRLAVSGISQGPGLYDILATLGQETVVERIRKTIEVIKKVTA